MSGINIVTANFTGNRDTTTRKLFQYDYGQKLKIKGLNLPNTFQVDFSNQKMYGTAKKVFGSNNEVDIPDEYLLSGQDIYAFIFLHQQNSDGETRHIIKIPVNKRSKSSEEQPTPVQRGTIETAIAALNEAVQKTQQNVQHYPKIVNGHWYIYDVQLDNYIDTNIKAEGNSAYEVAVDQGYSGTIGEWIASLKGNPGTDGHSPEITASKSNKTTTIYVDGITIATIADGESDGDFFDRIANGTGEKSLKFNNINNIDASGSYSIAQGNNTTASGDFSHAEGGGTVASGDFSHAEGSETTASGDQSHAEGFQTESLGDYSHTEGGNTLASENYSHAEGHRTTASGNASHAQGKETTASGNYSHAEGNSARASGNYSHAQGTSTVASNIQSHAEGDQTTASGSSSHAEGTLTTSSGNSSHAEGNQTNAANSYSHAEGDHTTTSGNSSHAEGIGGTYSLNNTTFTSAAVGTADHTEGYQTRTSEGVPGNHAEGYQTSAIGGASHSEGYQTTASGNFSHAEGSMTTASGVISHAEGGGTVAQGLGSHAQGSGTTASGNYCHAEGGGTTASGVHAHAEGGGTVASGAQSHAEGNETMAYGIYSHAEGSNTKASNYQSHAEGKATFASGESSHAEGYGTIAEGKGSHVEGLSKNPNNYIGCYSLKLTGDANATTYSYEESLDEIFEIGRYLFYDDQPYKILNIDTENNTITFDKTLNGIAVDKRLFQMGLMNIGSGISSHAEGRATYAKGSYSHAEGYQTRALNENSHAEGNRTIASGIASHVEGIQTIANHKSQHVFGEYNIADPSIQNTTDRGNYIQIVGKGTADNARSNARTLDWNGNEILAGKLTIGTAPTENMDVTTKQYVDASVAAVLPSAPLNDGTYILKCTVNNGIPAYTWINE